MCIRVSPTGLDAQRSMAAEKEAIEEFAQANGIEIVGEYIDEDDGRLASPALKRLVADARFPECNFRTVLVYEMSRSSPGAYAPIQLQMSFVPHPVTTAVTNPFPYQLFEIRLCCNRSIKPLYGLFSSSCASGGRMAVRSRIFRPVSGNWLPGGDCRQPFSRLRSPVGAAPPSLLGERLLLAGRFPAGACPPEGCLPAAGGRSGLLMSWCGPVSRRRLCPGSPCSPGCCPPPGPGAPGFPRAPARPVLVRLRSRAVSYRWGSFAAASTLEMFSSVRTVCSAVRTSRTSVSEGVQPRRGTPALARVAGLLVLLGCRPGPSVVRNSRR